MAKSMRADELTNLRFAADVPFNDSSVVDEELLVELAKMILERKMLLGDAKFIVT
jgi:hypothetical protein